MSTDLERLRRNVLAARSNPEPLPPRQRRLAQRHAAARRKGWVLSDLVVTRNGEIKSIQETGKESSGISRVTTEVFAAVDEVSLAQKYLPDGHAMVEFEGVSGWAYDLETGMGDQFTFFLYRDRWQRCYRVRLIAPALEKLGLVHATHLYSDGHLCLGTSYGAGEALLSGAFAKSAMWADGISQMLAGHSWPWGE